MYYNPSGLHFITLEFFLPSLFYFWIKFLETKKNVMLHPWKNWGNKIWMVGMGEWVKFLWGATSPLPMLWLWEWFLRTSTRSQHHRVKPKHTFIRSCRLSIRGNKKKMYTETLDRTLFSPNIRLRLAFLGIAAIEKNLKIYFDDSKECKPTSRLDTSLPSLFQFRYQINHYM